MPATTLKRVRGEDVEVVLAKAADAPPISNWTDTTIDITITEMDATVASAGFEQFVPGRRKFTGSCKGLVGGAETMATLPQVGDVLESLSISTVTEGVELIPDLGDETKWGKVVVIKTNYTQGKDLGSYGFDFRSGGL